MPKVHQASIGIERQVTQNLSVQASYPDAARSQPAAVDQHQRAGPIRCAARYRCRHITQFDSTGKSQSDRLELRGTYRFPQRNIFMNVNYTLGQVKNHADSATALPADNLHPDAEWGPSRQDVRHRIQGLINVPIVFGVRIEHQRSGAVGNALHDYHRWR